MTDLSAISKLDDLEVAGKRLLVRADFDGAVANGQLIDDRSIQAILPTVERLVEKNARVILMGHLGQPMGKVVPALSMEPVGIRLAELLKGGEVTLTDACVGDGAKRVALDLRDGQVALLENLHFHVGESTGDDKFARELASLGEVYLGEAFSLMHLSLASTVGVPKFMNKRACGLLAEKEIAALEHFLKAVKRPYVAVVGGSRFSLRVDLIQSLMERADTVLFGGAVANTLVAATKAPLGRTEVAENLFPNARDLVSRAKAGGPRFLFPTDVVVSSSADATVMESARIEAVPTAMAVVDIGPETRTSYKEVISRAGTILWTGAMGAPGNELFQAGTLAVIRAIAGSTAFSLAAGDEAARAVAKFGLEKGFSHVSTGDDATLKLLEGKVLPGIESLARK